jgi:hypothetical protein
MEAKGSRAHGRSGREGSLRAEGAVSFVFCHFPPPMAEIDDIAEFFQPRIAELE